MEQGAWSGLDSERWRDPASRLSPRLLKAPPWTTGGGLKAGATYLAKPFSPRELEVRVEALLRRAGRWAQSEEDKKDRFEVGGLVIDKRRHEVSVGGNRVELTPLEFHILERLASEPGRAWSRNDLLDEVWSTSTKATAQR